MELAGLTVSVAILAFVAGVVGLKLHIVLPERDAPDRARDMIGAMTGLLGLLLALVLGTLIGASYTLYATQKAELETLAARSSCSSIPRLKLTGRRRRKGARDCEEKIQQSFDEIWGGQSADIRDMSIKSVVAGSKTLDQFLLSLTPKTDAQKQLLATANGAAGQIAQTRILMMLQLAGISRPMLAIVICWSLLLFCGYGLVSPINATVIVWLAMGSLSVASAIFLIVELSQPYSGLFRIPPYGLIQAIEALGSG